MSLMPIFRSDLPFDQEDAHRYLPWIIAAMTALAAFIMAAGLTLGHLFISYTSEFDYRLQIQLPYADGEESGRAERMLEDLADMPEIERAARVSDRDMAELLSPWLGSAEAMDVLPVPTVIDAWMDQTAYDNGSMNAQILQKRLSRSFPNAVVDDFRQWAADFHSVMAIMKQLAWLMSILIVGAVVTVVLLISRASVQLHFPIVTLLHRIGAQDAYISRQFQLNAAWLTFKGALIGVALAASLYILIGGIVEGMNLPLLPEGVLFFSHALLFLFLPILMSLLVAATTRLSVQGMITRLY